ncbi:MAG TPA: hypothetical protein PLD20_10385 [Blastocatellia bacterium]|nr:hypothetical protein [Blastocatellia bacterium]HMV85211.1 hypothetical protein [Blastocatellia bacterium]HMX24583.1 hypothetical protein [Blastocatellia bacterium]HMY72285.1 hypothetical protein [Blastocatellia bacterium]HMZ18326.1 hypothetical protein [Blastocatellia bacterium]
MEKEQRSELTEEYFKLSAFVQAYDAYFLSIKNWGVTVSGAALGVSFSKDLIAQDKQILVLIIALILAVAFWLTEVRFKLIQLAHIYRQLALEKAIQENTYIQNPAILTSYGQGRSFDEKQKRWRLVMFWPQVMLPHIIFVSLSLIFIVVHIVRWLKR